MEHIIIYHSGSIDDYCLKTYYMTVFYDKNDWTVGYCIELYAYKLCVS